MSHWFRYYVEALHDPKVLRLSDSMFRAWVNLLCVAKLGDGAIRREDVPIQLRVSEKGAAAIIDYLLERDFLDDRGDFLTPHNWDARQYKSDVTDPTAAKRQKSYRERNKTRNGDRNGDRNATVTVTATRAETETEQRIDSASDVHAEFLRVAKTDPDDPILFGSQYGIQAMIGRGFSRETILAGAANAMRGKERPPNWNYFAKCIESENEQRSAPAKTEIDRGKSENLAQTAKRLSAEIVGFGPRPSLTGGGTNSPDVRLLSEGGGERS